MASVEASIEGALFARIIALSLTPALRLAGLTAEVFTPGATETYLFVQHIPNAVARPFIGSTDPQRRYGMLQVTVVGPKATGNPIDYTEIAGQVAAWFPTDLNLWNNGLRVRVMQAPAVENRIDAGTNWNVPVTVQYECYV